MLCLNPDCKNPNKNKNIPPSLCCVFCGKELLDFQEWDGQLAIVSKEKRDVAVRLVTFMHGQIEKKVISVAYQNDEKKLRITVAQEFGRGESVHEIDSVGIMRILQDWKETVEIA